MIHVIIETKKIKNSKKTDKNINNHNLSERVYVYERERVYGQGHNINPKILIKILVVTESQRHHMSL